MPALLALVLLLLTAVPAEAAGRCRAPTGGKVLLRAPGVTLHVRTIEPSAEKDGATFFTACPRGARKRVLIARASSDGVGAASFARTFTVTGRYVAYEAGFSNHYGDGSSEVIVKAWRNGRQRRAIDLGRTSGFCGPGYDSDRMVRDLEVTRQGRVAFLLDRTPCLENRRDEIRGSRGQILDSGATGSLTGLSVTRTTVSWLHDGRPRSAPL